MDAMEIGEVLSIFMLLNSVVILCVLLFCGFFNMRTSGVSPQLSFVLLLCSFVIATFVSLSVLSTLVFENRIAIQFVALRWL